MQALAAWNRLPAVIGETGSWQDGQRTAPWEWKEEQGCFPKFRMADVRVAAGMDKV